MEEKQNPNSHKRLRQLETSNYWSELPIYLLNLVFQRLSFANFQRAKSVCSSWHSASRQSVPKSQTHWLILFPENINKEKSCKLFNPEEKDKLYKTQDLGLEFGRSLCIATYGSWLLMQDSKYTDNSLYIVNLFTRERINLPPVESQIGMVNVEIIWNTMYLFRISNMKTESKSEVMHIQSPVFWIDENTKDYIVIWGLGFRCVVSDRKLYFLSCFGSFKIFNLSGEIAQQTFQCGVKPEIFRLGKELGQLSSSWCVIDTKLVVTVTGIVLKVKKLWRKRSRTWSFQVFKIYASGLLKEPELIKSLGDESMLLDQGITVLVNDTDGFIRNCIYFSGNDHEKNTNNIFIFNLKTQKTEPLHRFDRSLAQFSRAAQWFLPSFTHTRC
ncbi:hypothetical protein ARALYDRAFT_914405 [Arabidopsis lyrata subsp. lyrata]|uniref:F-box domain-containing protein n=1 Tax=Arabidopsis lyrata subsp. lyrata TaxID=81972 RepID=D7ME71_ARALL|nr:hypothetical protein ARALYDRAFT_914405 [Arabidopsis lyrata subsp. lyrata]